MALRIALESLLSGNRALDDLLRDIASGRSKVAARPEGRETTQDRILLAEMLRREPLALLDHLCGRVSRPDAYEKMDMIGLNRQRHNRPPTFSTLLFNEGTAVLRNGATQHGFPSLGTPDQMVDDQVDAVFISLIFHVDIRVCKDILNNNKVLQEGLKPRRKAPHLWGLIPAACGGLKPVSVTNVPTADTTSTLGVPIRPAGLAPPM